MDITFIGYQNLVKCLQRRKIIIAISMIDLHAAYILWRRFILLVVDVGGAVYSQKRHQVNMVHVRSVNYPEYILYYRIVADLSKGIYYQKCHDPDCKRVNFRSQG